MTGNTVTSRPLPLRDLRTALVGAVVALLLVPPVRIEAQESARSVLERARELQVERLADVEALTVVFRTLDRLDTLRLEKRTDDGPAYLKPVSGFGVVGHPRVPQTPYRTLERLADRFSLVGRDTVDGRPSYVLEMRDFSGTADSVFGGMQSLDLVDPEVFRVVLDTADLLIRKTLFRGSVAFRGERLMRYGVRLRDYRNHRGLLYPHRFEGSMDIEMSEAERAQIEELRRRLESMSEEERSRLEEMGGGATRLLDLMSGRMEILVRVEEVSVEGGRPGDS